MMRGIVERLQQGRIQAVVPYGSNGRPNPPYIVTKIEGAELRVWVHYPPDYQTDLEQYWIFDLPELLNGYEYETPDGQTVKIYPDINPFVRPGYSTIVKNDDGTISKERRFDLP